MTRKGFPLCSGRVRDHSVGPQQLKSCPPSFSYFLEWTKSLPNDFSGLGLSTKVTEAVTAAGYTTPTDIQAQAIPHVLQKRDIIGIAQTGTGKTASFVLPMLTLLESGRARARMPRTLILEPTRELAAQVHENFERYGKNHRLSVALLIGGVSFDEQNKKLDRGADVLIATPGRMLDQFERGRILLSGVDIASRPARESGFLRLFTRADGWRDLDLVPSFRTGVFHEHVAWAFIAALAEGAALPSGLADGLGASAMIEAAYRAAATGVRQDIVYSEPVQ